MKNRFYLFLGICISIVCSACNTQNSQKIQHQDEELLSQKVSIELRKGVSIYFDHNSSLIRPQDNKILLAVASILKSDPKLFLVLEGHTDNSGSEVTNQKISFARVNTVKSELSRIYNVNPDQLITKAKGANYPIESNETESGRANNRRVTMILKAH